MADGNYFVRSKGRISGPFDILALQKLVRRRLLSRFDEVSPDRATWSVAGEFQELFGSMTAVAVEDSPTDVVSEFAQQHAPPPPNTERFYYSQAGATVGPVPLNVLRALAENGTLRWDDVVWQENSQV